MSETFASAWERFDRAVKDVLASTGEVLGVSPFLRWLAGHSRNSRT